jgi:hypothetical protein
MSTTLSQSVEGDVLNDANSAAAAIASALDRRAWETARRLALVALNDRPGNRQLLKLLHRAMRALGDLEGCRFALGQMTSANAEEHLELILLQAEDAHRHGEAKFYRTSSELAAGYTLEEYQEKMHAEAERQFAQAIALAQTPQTRRQVAQVLRRCRRNAQADALWPGSPAGRQPFRPGEPNQAGGLEGQLRFPDGTPVANATVTLGLAVEVKWPDVPRMITSDMHVGATIGRQNALTTTTDASGRYHFGHVPAGTHAFLAVTLDPSEHDIPTRFVAHEVNVPANAVGRLDATVDEWKRRAEGIAAGADHDRRCFLPPGGSAGAAQPVFL